MAFTLVAALAGCTDDFGPALAGLPDDFASATPADAAGTASAPAVITAFDGYYVGTLAPASGQPVCMTRSGPEAQVGTPLAVPRDMLVVDGRATFGANLPFTGLVNPDGDVLLRYLDFGTLAGRFADRGFTGALAAGSDPACRWAVRMDLAPDQGGGDVPPQRLRTSR